MTAATKTSPNGAAPDAGEAQYLTAEQLIENAPADCIEVDVEDVFGGKVRIRALTAGQSAQVRQKSISTQGRGVDVVWAEMEREQFRLGVIVPKLNADQVKTLHLQSGRSFAKVIAELDRISGLDKEELRNAQKEFHDADTGA